jgi:hypothetical protein
MTNKIIYPVDVPSATPTTITPPPATDREYLYSITVAAWLPLIQSTITASVIGISGYVIARLFDVQEADKIAGLIGAMVWSVSWIALHRRWMDVSTIQRIEQLTGWDLNGDGSIGTQDQREPSETIRVVIDNHQDGQHTTQQFDLPVAPGQFAFLAQGLLAGIPYSEREWTGAGKPFSINEFRDLRAEMIRRGLITLASEKDARQGYVLTRPGRAVMKYYSPTPSMEAMQ